MALKDFFNKISNSDRIYTAEDIGRMDSEEFIANEPAIDYQLNNLGIPREAELAASDEVYVRSYTRDDGTKVRAYYRSKPNPSAAENSADQSPVLYGGVQYDDYKNTADKSFLSDIKFDNSLNPLSYLPENVYLQIPQEMTAEEKIYDALGWIASQNMGIWDKNIGLFPVAGANLQNARRNFEVAKNNTNAYIVQSRSEIKNKGLNNLMDKVDIPKNSRGVIYDYNSRQSKQLFKSPEIQDYLRKNYSELLSNKHDNTTEIEFKKHNLFDDNYYGLQHCTLYNPHITSDGYFSGAIVDYYDFEHRKGNNLPTKINNWGYSMQEKGLLENQFNIYVIHEKLW